MSAKEERQPMRPTWLTPRAVLAVGVGNALEFYDFGTHALLYTLATFGVARERLTSLTSGAAHC